MRNVDVILDFNEEKYKILHIINKIYGLELDSKTWEEKEDTEDFPQTKFTINASFDFERYCEWNDYFEKDSYEFWEEVENEFLGSYLNHKVRNILKRGGFIKNDRNQNDFVYFNPECDAFDNVEIKNLNNLADIERFKDVLKENDFVR